MICLTMESDTALYLIMLEYRWNIQWCLYVLIKKAIEMVQGEMSHISVTCRRICCPLYLLIKCF